MSPEFTERSVNMSLVSRSAQDYWLQMSEAGLTEISMQVSSLAEAKAVLAELLHKEKQLRHIKQNVNLEMKRIRVEYRQRLATAAEVSSAFMQLIAGRKAGAEMRADKKRSLTRERDGKLRPYDDVKLKIDEMLTQIDGAKLQLDQYIDDAPCAV